MDAVVAVVVTLIGTLIVAAILYDLVRMITTDEARCPPLARLRGRRAALEAAERWCVGLRLHGQIGSSTYQRRMSALARGERTISGRT
ncbi:MULTISPECIES: hypothetical protein [Streptosporangium]|uniref:Uncharacterized protein n=1 Tax=Streptosporangium brasiliense TaxID=47480 RepID=A0ABT9RI98_9ACTN|nr:hypothetical protein [Streptosporangium brasiliense]MDP9868793.1 hypothetical protein [Streptosporangium brasiliense]